LSDHDGDELELKNKGSGTGAPWRLGPGAITS